jgi:hypothetical protein
MVPREIRGPGATTRAPHETGRGNSYPPMKTQPTPTYTVGSVTFQAYEKFGPHIQPAPNGRELAELYDKAAKQIELCVHALKLCCPLTPAAYAARSAAFDAVMEDMKS